MTHKKYIIISGGGTGGHIYPAISIGKAIADLDSTFEVHYVGTKNGLEQKIMAKENLPLHLIQSGPLNLSGHVFKKIKNIVSICFGFIQSVLLIQKMKPEFVLGVGGYASAPFLLAAALLGRKTALWEPNAYPGMANRLLSKFVPKAYLVFADTDWAYNAYLPQLGNRELLKSAFKWLNPNSIPAKNGSEDLNQGSIILISKGLFASMLLLSVVLFELLAILGLVSIYRRNVR